MADITSGNILRVYKGADAIAKETECSFKLSLELKEVIHKDIEEGWVERVPGKLSAELSGSNMYAEDEGYEDITTAMTTKANLTCVVGDKTTSGSKVWAGAFLFTSCDSNYPDGDSSTYSYSAKSDGELTYDAPS
jgi:hypothetical protein